MQIKIPKGKSKKVLDFNTIKDDARLMMKFLKTYRSPSGKGPENHYAIHHSQFSSDPYNFFVIANHVVDARSFQVVMVINPEILEVDPATKKREVEGCMSYPFRPGKSVIRYNKIRVAYDVPSEDGKSMEHKVEWVGGFLAQIFQHEVEHAKGNSIYSK